MDFPNIKDALRRELSHVRCQEVYDRARSRTPLLSNHSTPLSVLAVMHDKTGSWDEKDALTRALVREQQDAPDEVWTALLIAAYLPMLRKLRRRVLERPPFGVDLDQLTVSCFLSTVGNFRLARHTHHTCLRLRQRTARAFFQKLKAEKRYAPLFSPIELDEELLNANSAWSHLRPRTRRELDDDEHVELAAMLRERVGQAIAAEKLDLVIATALLREDLRTYVARTFTGASPAALEREYERLKRRRSRTLAHLRKILGEDCPRSEPPCL
jgi:hypothetical protein